MAIFGKKKTEKSAKDKVVKKADDKKTSMKEMYADKKKAAAPGKKTVEAKTKKKFANAYRVLVRPLITEKASILQQENKYVFEVSENSNKIEVAKAIEEVYNIKPVAVNTVRVIGKRVRSGKTRGKRRDWKKAVVTLPAGKTIKIYEGV